MSDCNECGILEDEVERLRAQVARLERDYENAPGWDERKVTRERDEARSALRDLAEATGRMMDGVTDTTGRLAQVVEAHAHARRVLDDGGSR